MGVKEPKVRPTWSLLGILNDVGREVAAAAAPPLPSASSPAFRFVCSDDCTSRFEGEFSTPEDVLALSLNEFVITSGTPLGCKNCISVIDDKLCLFCSWDPVSAAAAAAALDEPRLSEASKGTRCVLLDQRCSCALLLHDSRVVFFKSSQPTIKYSN